MQKYKVSELFNPDMYFAPGFSSDRKAKIFSRTSRKKRSFTSVIKKHFVEVALSMMLVFVVAFNLDYIQHLGKPLEIDHQELYIDSMTAELEILKNDENQPTDFVFISPSSLEVGDKKDSYVEEPLQVAYTEVVETEPLVIYSEARSPQVTAIFPLEEDSEDVKEEAENNMDDRDFRVSSEESISATLELSPEIDISKEAEIAISQDVGEAFTSDSVAKTAISSDEDKILMFPESSSSLGSRKALVVPTLQWGTAPVLSQDGIRYTITFGLLSSDFAALDGEVLEFYCYIEGHPDISFVHQHKINMKNIKGNQYFLIDDLGRIFGQKIFSQKSPLYCREKQYELPVHKVDIIKVLSPEKER